MAAIVKTERDDYTGDVIRTHDDGTVSVIENDERGYWVSDRRWITGGYRPQQDGEGRWLCGTCGTPVEPPVGPWDGETWRGGFAATYGWAGCNITSVRCRRHEPFYTRDPETGESL